MNTFNRIVIVLLLLILIPVLSYIFIVPHVVLGELGAWATAKSQALWQMNPMMRLAGGIAAAVVVDILFLFLIYLELRRPKKQYIHVQKITGGVATLSVDSIVQQIQYRLDPVEGVIKVRPEVTAKGQKVRVAVDVLVQTGYNLPELASRLVDEVKEVITQELGLQPAGDPIIRMKVAAPSKGRKPPVPSLPKPEPAPSAEEEGTEDVQQVE